MTFFTNTDAFIVKKISQFCRGVLKDNGISGFVIYSDGAESLTEDSYATVQQLVCANLISKQTADKHINELFDSLVDMSSDDISVSVLSVITAKSSETARATYNRKISEKIPETIPVDFPDETAEFNNYVEQTLQFLPESTEIKANNRDNDSNDEFTEKKNADTSLMAFLTLPRTFDDILASGLIKSHKIIPVLNELINSGMIFCDDDFRFADAVTKGSAL